MKVLFHDGDLKIEYGGLKGTGALFVTGKLEIAGQADLATTALCAIVAKQGLVLKGSGKERSSVHGLVYSEGPVVVQDVTVIGSLVNGLSDTSASPPPMQLSNAAFVRDAAVFRLEIDLQFGSKSTDTMGARGGSSGLSLGLPPATADSKSGFGPLRYLDSKTGKLLAVYISNNPDPVKNAEEVKAKLQPAIQKDLEDHTQFRRGSEMVSFHGLSPTEQAAAASAIETKRDAVLTALTKWTAQPQERPPYKLTLDLNQFVKVQNRLRVVGRQISRVQ